MSSQFIVNPLAHKSSNLANQVNIPVNEKNNQESQTTKISSVRWLIIVFLLTTFLIIIPVIEFIVGRQYIETTTCTTRNINGTQVLSIKGVFGLMYFALFVIHSWYRRIYIHKSLWTNLSYFHFSFLIATILYAAIHLILMSLEFAVLKGCSDLISHVRSMLWVSAFTTISAILFVIYSVLAPCLC